MMKKLLSLLLAASMLFGLGAASAQTTSKDDMLTVVDMINAKTESEYDDYQLGEEVVVDGLFTFTLTNMQCVESDQEGMMQVQCYVTITGLMEELSASDYDFSLVTRANAAHTYEYYWAEDVYGIIGSDRRIQPFAWPIILPTEEPLELVFIYTVPKTETMLGFLYSNIWGDGTTGFESKGNMKLYTKIRTVMDCRFVNNSGKTLKELYIVPSDNGAWGDNLLSFYEDPTLPNNFWLVTEFASSQWADATGKQWEIRVVFDDGTEATFSRIELDDIMCLELVPAEEEGSYSLDVTF